MNSGMERGINLNASFIFLQTKRLQQLHTEAGKIAKQQTASAWQHVQAAAEALPTSNSLQAKGVLQEISESE